MIRIIIVIVALATVLPAQTQTTQLTELKPENSETSFLWARVASNSAPSEFVVVDLRVTVLRTGSGALESGSISWRLRPDLRTPVEITALHIYRQDAPGSETLAFEYPFTPAVTLRGAAAINRSLPDVIPVRRDDMAGIRRLQALLDDPARYYVTFMGEGVRDFRGHIFKADHQVFMSMISGGGFGPEGSSRAVIQIVPITARDHSGRVVFAQVLVQGTYRLPGQTAFTALQIHKGEDGAPVISVPLAGVTSAASGAGDLPGLFATVLPEDEQGYAALHEMLAAPERFRVTLQAAGTPQITLRGPVRRTERITFPLRMNARTVPEPPPDWDDSSIWTQTVHVLRDELGRVQAATYFFELSLRFPKPVGVWAIDIHKGRAGVDGPSVHDFLRRSPSDPLLFPTGFGSGLGIRQESFLDGRQNEFINDLLAHPEDYYVDVHVDRISQPSSRAHFGEPLGPPLVDRVLRANLDPATGPVAPGSIISIFGQNLAAVRGDLSGWEGARLPESLNGVTVGLDRLRAFPIFVSPTQINAVLPFETPIGSQQLAISNGKAISPEVTIRIANVAPAMFASAIVRLSDGSLVSSTNPARSGEIIRIYLTGLGQTNPPLTSGLIVREHRPVRMPVSVLFGEQRFEVNTSTAAPGIPGLYQLDIRVPMLASGAVRLALSIDNVTSTPVMIPVL